jgi:hypothetical protein
VSELDQLREIALSFPDVSERLSHGATCFFVRDKRPLCYFHDHHNDDRMSVWCPARPGLRDQMVAGEPERFFKPPMSAKGTFSGWLGVFVDMPGERGADWGEVAEIIEDAFRLVAPVTAIAALDRSRRLTSGP